MAQNIGIIIALNLIVYFRTLRYRYVSDDIPSAQRTPHKNPFIHALWVLEGHSKSVSYKLMEKGYAPQYLPQVDHLITIVLHTLVCIGLYLGFGHNSVSFIAALLFSVNPINNQGSIWISGRGYVLAALGMTWALVLPTGMALVMLMVACYSNAGFLMPLVMGGSPHPYLIFFAPFVWAFYAKNFYKNVKQKMDMETVWEDTQYHWGKAVVVLKTFGFYLSHSIIPIKTTFYHSLLESMAGSKAVKAYKPDRFFVIGALSLLAMALYIFTHKWDMVCFAMLWWCVGIAPFCNFRRMQQEISERYCYVPNVGAMIMLASIIHSYPIIISAFLAMYTTKIWFYMESYKDDFWLVEYATFNSPDSWFAWHLRGVQRWQARSFQEAIIYWVMAKNLSPREFKILYNLGVALLLTGNLKESLNWVAEAEKHIPRGQEKIAGAQVSGIRKLVSDIDEAKKKNPNAQISVNLQVLI